MRASLVTAAPTRRLAAHAANAILVAAGYYVAARVGFAYHFQNSQIGVVWPANAILMCALLLAPRAQWWLVLASAAVAHVAVVHDLVPAWRWCWQIAANSLLAIGTAAALRRYAGLPLRFDSRRQVFAYTAIAFVMPALFSLISSAFVLSLLGRESTGPLATLSRVMLSNVTGMLLVGPVVLLWGTYAARRLSEVPRRRLIEGATMMLSLLAVGAIAFGAGGRISRAPSVLLWMLPSLLWATVRFGPVGASTSLFCVAALSLWGTGRQLGPFALFADADEVFALQVFWIVLGPPLMLLAAVIREREQAEDSLHEQRNQLAHVTRVATAGELSGAIAHEVRQPLMSILANAQAGLRMIECGAADLDELRAIFHDIAQQDKQAAGVIARLRAFLKEGESRFEPLAVETLVRDALALGRSTVEFSGVSVQTNIAPGLPRVLGDPVQLLQVMLNLVVNGCESMHAVPAPDRRLRLQVARAGPQSVEVQVADCGVGLPAGGEDGVFEPFFTTKDRGLGLGLTISRSIATSHGGRLWCENNARSGATFHLVLPADGVNGASAHATAHWNS